MFTETSEFCAGISTAHLQNRRVKKEVASYKDDDDEEVEDEVTTACLPRFCLFKLWQKRVFVFHI